MSGLVQRYLAYTETERDKRLPALDGARVLFVLFVGWKMPRPAVWDEFTNGGSLAGNRRIFGAVWFLIRYIAPLVILTIFVTNLLA